MIRLNYLTMVPAMIVRHIKHLTRSCSMRIVCGLLITLTIVSASCAVMKRSVRDSYKYELYIDYKYVSYQGRNTSQAFCFEIDSTNGMWYYGTLILDRRDTILLRGFEKGNMYPTVGKQQDKTFRVFLKSFVEQGAIPDSISLEAPGLATENVMLYRRARPTAP